MSTQELPNLTAKIGERYYVDRQASPHYHEVGVVEVVASGGNVVGLRLEKSGRRIFFLRTQIRRY